MTEQAGVSIRATWRLLIPKYKRKKQIMIQFPEIFSVQCSVSNVGQSSNHYLNEAGVNEEVID